MLPELHGAGGRLYQHDAASTIRSKGELDGGFHEEVQIVRGVLYRLPQRDEKPGGEGEPSSQVQGQVQAEEEQPAGRDWRIRRRVWGRRDGFPRGSLRAQGPGRRLRMQGK